MVVTCSVIPEGVEFVDDDTSFVSAATGVPVSLMGWSVDIVFVGINGVVGGVDVTGTVGGFGVVFGASVVISGIFASLIIKGIC